MHCISYTAHTRTDRQFHWLKASPTQIPNIRYSSIFACTLSTYCTVAYLLEHFCVPSQVRLSPIAHVTEDYGPRINKALLGRGVWAV